MKHEHIDNQPSGCCSGQKTEKQTGYSEQNQNRCCNESENQTQNECCGGGCCGSMHDAEESYNGLDDATHNQSVKELDKMVSMLNDKYIRMYSEFENFKKRTSKERIALINSANEKTLKELLPIVDDFERSIAAFAASEDISQNAVNSGTKLIYDKLVGLLHKSGVQQMVIEEGSVFDGDFHEAILQQPVENPTMKGKIITVTEKGYLLHGQVLRFAKVVIGL